MKIFALLGRVLFSLIYLFSGFSHFMPSTAAYAGSQGLPMAGVLVPVSGIMIIIGALSIILGFKARIGAVLILLFLIPASFIFHHFWDITDPMMKQMQMIMFMKNVSMMGGALLIVYFGSGPLSIDNARKK